nr:response regulator [Azospirillum formosense]
MPEADPPAGNDAPCAAELLVHRRPARILLAEDMAMNRELITAMLQGAGHRVDAVPNGQQAVEAVQRGAYDLVLMDVHMPELDGHCATRAIRGLPPPVGSIPILAMSASALPDEVQRCHDAGMNGHIAKPVDRATMLDAIDGALGWAVQGGRAAEHPDGAPRSGAVPETFMAVESIPLRQPLDRAMLAQLSDELGEESCARLAVAFLDELPQRMSRLRKSRESGSPLAEAQALIAPAASLGLVRLASACRALSAALRAGRRHEAEGLADSVLDAAEEGAEALRDTLSRGRETSRFKSLAKDIVRTP